MITDTQGDRVEIKEMNEDRYEMLRWVEMNANGDRTAADYQG